MDENRFPRKNVHFPDRAQNSHGAWAWKCTVSDEVTNEGKLAGKTFALKDNVALKGVPMLLGTDFIKGFVPDCDATVATRILEAGGTILGKAVCENMCHSATSHSSGTGIVENPFAKGYSAGGSSSGSGVLVALGEVDGAIGADQGGSIRVPAANLGLIGFKPTFGLVPYTGCGSNEPTNDHLGPMTRTVLENAHFLEAIAGNDNIDDRSFAKNAEDVGTGMVGAPACGDVMKLQIRVGKDGVIEDAKFKTYGCGSAIASSSLVTEWVKGKTLDEVQQLTRAFKGMMSIHEQSLDGDGNEPTEALDADVKLGDLEALRGVVKFPVRIKCATLSWNTLQQALDEPAAS